MNVRISKGIGLIAALYFTANIQAQVKDTITKERKIEEVVLIGYGSVKKENLTTSVGQVNEKQFEDRPIYSAAQALQGNVSGVNVVQPSGKPGKSIEVKIRGTNSITSGINTLYVIDGVQTNDLGGINPNDIVEMTVLKDATATAIYGTNGSGGVVIITTKKPKRNQKELSFNAYWGISKVVNNIDVLNLDQYKTLLQEISNNGGQNYLGTAENARYDGINTNWRDEVYQNGFDQNYNIGYNVGTEKVRLYTNIGYQSIDGVVKPAKFTRFTAKANLDADITDWLKFNTSLNYFTTNLRNTTDNLGVARGGVVLGALNTPQFLPVYGSDVNFITGDTDVYDTDGSILDGYKEGQFAPNPYQSSWENPVAYQSRKDETNDYRYMSFFGLEAQIIKGLTWKTNFSYDYIDSDNVQFINPYSTNYGRQERGRGSHNTYLFQNKFLENFATYKFKKGISDVEIIAGNTLQWKHYKYYAWTGQGYDDITLRDFDYNSAETKYQYETETARRDASFFGRVVYTLNGKYTIMAVGRYNASSALRDKWGFFPGVSGSWLISKENFMKDSSVVSLLKLRGGWGKTANISGIPDYPYSLESLNYVFPTDGQTWTWTQQGNANLGWEVTTDTNVGLDLAF